MLVNEVLVNEVLVNEVLVNEVLVNEPLTLATLGHLLGRLRAESHGRRRTDFTGLLGQ